MITPISGATLTLTDFRHPAQQTEVRGGGLGWGGGGVKEMHDCVTQYSIATKIKRGKTKAQTKNCHGSYPNKCKHLLLVLYLQDLIPKDNILSNKALS